MCRVRRGARIWQLQAAAHLVVAVLEKQPPRLLVRHRRVLQFPLALPLLPIGSLPAAREAMTRSRVAPPWRLPRPLSSSRARPGADEEGGAGLYESNL